MKKKMEKKGAMVLVSYGPLLDEGGSNSLTRGVGE